MAASGQLFTVGEEAGLKGLGEGVGGGFCFVLI